VQATLVGVQRVSRVAALAAVISAATTTTAVVVTGVRERPRPAAPPPPAPVRRPARVRPYRRPVPVLACHVIGTPRGPFPRLYLRPSAFAAEMRRLAAAGYHAVTLARVEDAWRGRRSLPRRPLVVSFDDGYRSDADIALPVLRRLGWPGVLFLELGRLDRPDGLTRAQVRTLMAAGWELGAHTITHPDLTTLRPPPLRREVAGSRRILRRDFHVAVVDFAYPLGRYDRAVVREVRSAGFRGAVTERLGLARRSEILTMARIRLDSTISPVGLVRELRALSGRAR
jgi:peptidoglycan/xylan/chitin deacetylase (PgdA/CDA1 family)